MSYIWLYTHRKLKHLPTLSNGATRGEFPDFNLLTPMFGGNEEYTLHAETKDFMFITLSHFLFKMQSN